MQDLKVTLVQADQIWEDKQANFNNYKKLLADLGETDLILLPEMFNTGFSMNAVALAEDFNHSPSIDWLKELSKEKNAAIYTSLIIKVETSYFNRGVFIQPTGSVAVYDKRQTFSLAGEDKVFQSGTEQTIVEYKGWKINLQICYDLRFPELSLNKLENNNAQYDLSLYVANWPEKRIAHWDALLVARAIENQAFVIGVNRFGIDHNDLSYNGHSQIIDALGEPKLLNQAETTETFVLNHSDLMDTRTRLPFLKDRSH